MGLDAQHGREPKFEGEALDDAGAHRLANGWLIIRKSGPFPGTFATRLALCDKPVEMLAQIHMERQFPNGCNDRRRRLVI